MSWEMVVYMVSTGGDSDKGAEAQRGKLVPGHCGLWRGLIPQMTLGVKGRSSQGPALCPVSLKTS